MNNLFKIVLLSITAGIMCTNNSYCMTNRPNSSDNTHSKAINNIEISKEEINKTDIEEKCKDFSQMLVNKAATITQFQSNYNALNKQFNEDNNKAEYSLDTIPNKQGINLEKYCTEETNKLQELVDSATKENIPEICDKYLKVLNNIISVLENISEDYENHIIYNIIKATKSALKRFIDDKKYLSKKLEHKRLTLTYSLTDFHNWWVLKAMNSFIQTCNDLNSEVLIVINNDIYGLNRFLSHYLKNIQSIYQDFKLNKIKYKDHEKLLKEYQSIYQKLRNDRTQLLNKHLHPNTKDTKDEIFNKKVGRCIKDIFHVL